MTDKKIIEIQKEYIILIESYFQNEITDIKDFSTVKEFEEYASESKSKSLFIGNFSKRITVFEDKFSKFIIDLDEFWKKHDDDIKQYCQNSSLNKVIIWTDEDILILSPKLLLYYDTVLIPDSLTTLGRIVIESGYYRDALMYFSLVSQLKEFISDNTDKPLIIFFQNKKSTHSNFLPKDSDMASQYLESQLGEISKNAFYKIINKQFDFTDIESLFSFINSSSISDLNENLNRELLKRLFFTYINNPSFLNMAYSEGNLDFIIKGRLEKGTLIAKDYLDIFSILVSMFSIFEGREYHSIFLNSINLITEMLFPFSQFKYDKLCHDYGNVLNISDEHLINYSINQNFDWVEHVDIKKCLRIRENGDFDNFRKILKSEANKIKSATFEEFPSVAVHFENEVKKQIEEEIKLIESQIKNIKTKKRISSASFGVTAGLSIASIAFPSLLPLTLVAAGYGLTYGENIKDLLNQLLTGKSKLKELGNRSLSIIINNEN